MSKLFATCISITPYDANGTNFHIEVKAAATVFKSDFKGLRKIKAAHSDRFKFGALLYDGEICASFGDGIYAIPIRMLWEGDKALSGQIKSQHTSVA